MSKLQPGDRVRYTRTWLRNTGQVTGPAGQRRGTVVGPVPGMPSHVGIRWDDADLRIYDDDAELQAHVAEHGEAVHPANVERVKRAEPERGHPGTLELHKPIQDWGDR